MKKNLKFAAVALTAFFAFSCASTPKPENASAQNEPQADQASEDKSSDQKENQSSENTQANSSETQQENGQDSNPLKKIVEQNIPADEFQKNNGNQNLKPNPPKVQTAPAARQQNQEQTENSNAENKNQIQQENSENQKNEDNAEKNLLSDRKNDTNENKNDISEEKINEDDLISDLENENAPTADEKNKVAEPDVSDFFEEPEVIEAEPEEKNDENQEPAEPLEEKTEISEQNQEENTKSEEAEKIKSSPEAVPSESENNPSETEEEKSDEKENPAPDSENESETKTEEIVPSRSVTIKRNQYLDVVYPGNGWIYLGENETSLLRYYGRKTGNGETAFSFRSIGTSSAGNTILHFYKNDALTGNYIDDYLEVIVENENAAGTERITAPSYAEIVPPRLERRKTEKQDYALPSEQISKDSDKKSLSSEDSNKTVLRKEDSNSSAAENKNAQDSQNSAPASAQKTPSNDNLKTVISNSDSGLKQTPAQNQQSQPENFYTQSPSPLADTNVEAEPEVQISGGEENQADSADESLLEKAQQLFDEKKYSESLENVQNFINGSSKRLDEAYYLLGQIYESDSSIKNVRNAVAAYETVTRDFPLSKLWKKASERSIYLKRFYIDIR